MNSPRGSIWRKWDLHIHTPASYDWDGGCKDKAEEIVKKAIAENISVIAITDHHTVAGIDEVVKAAKGKDITILPGVELRTDKGNKGIHIIGVFDSSVTSKTIYDKLLCPLNFSENDVKEKSDKEIYCNFEDACQKIHELGGLVLLHAGNKSNGIEQLDSDVRATLKRDLAFLVDIFEVSALKQVEDYRKIVFPKIKQEFPCIITSDACDRSKFQYKTGHSTEPIGKKYSWIKADPTFDGLKQIIYEPIIRICLDDSPPLYLHPQIVSAKLLNHQSYQSKKDIFPPITLNQELFFSPNLTTVIGPRATGKTALAELIGYVANKFSSDKGDKKLSLIEFLSREFPNLEVEITFQSGAEDPVSLKRQVKEWNDPFYTSSLQVEYWAQGDIEKKADSPKQITDYIGGRLHSDLLIKTKEELEALGEEMKTIRNDYAGKLQIEIDKKKLEAERKQIESYFKKLKTKEYKDLADKIKSNRAKRQLVNGLIQDIEDQSSLIKKFAGQLKLSTTVDKDKVLELFTGKDSLKKKIESFYNLKEAQLESVVKDLEGVAKEVRESSIKKELDKESTELTKQFTDYCKSNGVTITKSEVEKRNNRIKFIDQQLSQLENRLKMFEGDKKQHNQLVNQLKTKLKLWTKENQKLIDVFNESFKDMTITALWDDPSGDIASWIKEQFLQSNDELKGVIEKNFKTKSPVREDYVKDVVNELVGKSIGDAAREKIISTIKENKTPKLKDSGGKTETLRWFFEDPNTQIIREDLMMRLDEYTETGENHIKYGTKILGKDSMSFGERCGTLVELILLSGDHPLIIDQPEDHLDAKFVAEKVVTLVGEQKVNRQIIICSHNANIVVLGDSELVTALSVDDKSKVSALQGSLESIEMRKTIYDVLEGGENAFRKREQKLG